MFRGRAIGQRTEHEYDAEGRLRSSRTVVESAWLDSDRWMALALHEHEATLCPGCHHPVDRAWHPDQDGWYEVRTHECMSCQALAGHTPAGTWEYASTVDTRPQDRPLPDWDTIR